MSGAPITDLPRVRQVLADVSAEAETSGVPAEYVTAVFTDQINATEAVQYNRFSWWKLDPTAAPTVAPDLAASRARIDELNRLMVSRIAQQWPLLQSPDCGYLLETAIASVAQTRGLDPLYTHALDAATRSYCET